ncbi:MAG: hypothetical protein JSW09_10610 [Pseudomonadota bacterium]|nr:MAG: hypothetical protein JSW09_10610 [Pseudomonadota bacterium]
MKKIILISSFVLIAVIGAALYYVFTNLDAIVKAVIEKAGSQTTQTAVRVDKVKIVLTDGAGTINGLSIANPKGFETRHAFRLGAVETKIDIKSLTKEPYIIEKVIIRKPQVFYEMNKDRQGNLNILYDNIAAATAGSGSASKPATKSAEPKLIIRHFLFADATVEAKVVPLNNKEYTLKLPTIDLKDLGGKNGATPSEISQQVLRAVTERALAEVKRAGIDEKVQALKSEAQEKLDTKKSELEGKAGEKLKNLLKK